MGWSRMGWGGVVICGGGLYARYLQLELEDCMWEVRELRERRERHRSLPLIVFAMLAAHAQIRVQRDANRRVARLLEGSAQVVRAHRRPQLLPLRRRLHLGCELPGVLHATWQRGEEDSERAWRLSAPASAF